MGLGNLTRRAAGLAVFAATLLLVACSSLPARVQQTLQAPGLKGTRFGLVVMTMDGRELVAIRPDERFVPASNTKLFTVAAAFHRLGDVSRPDPSMGASVRIEPKGDAPPDVVLVGGGDAMLIDADDCERDCLSDLADMVLANGFKRIGSVIGDDQLFPHEPWGPGWNHDDLIYRSGAPASALVVNSNEVMLQIAPGEKPGDPVRAQWRDDDAYYDIRNEAVTVDGDIDTLRIDMTAGDSKLRLHGTLGAGARPQAIPIAANDPAVVAAHRFRRLLQERGVEIAGDVGSRHRLLTLADEPKTRGEGASSDASSAGAEIARLLPPPLIDDLRFLNKQSQNLHAEVVLRRLGLIEGGGSRAEGLAVIEAMLDEAGADREMWDLSDGSGMSTYNRVTPRMVASFLRWSSLQPWSEDFRSTLAVGGVDGTLSRRFRDTNLHGRIFAKTGTLTGTNTLSGFMLAASGQPLIFSAYANDRPEEAGSATAVLDQALLAVAAAY
jgi:D-alanyl-D-alanine carboxypeptidase/D-alanyl-D-alanine-endopeptidase (penicillin-binding protein 4)